MSGLEYAAASLIASSMGAFDHISKCSSCGIKEVAFGSISGG